MHQFSPPHTHNGLVATCNVRMTMMTQVGCENLNFNPPSTFSRRYTNTLWREHQSQVRLPIIQQNNTGESSRRELASLLSRFKCHHLAKLQKFGLGLIEPQFTFPLCQSKCREWNCPDIPGRGKHVATRRSLHGTQPLDTELTGSATAAGFRIPAPALKLYTQLSYW